MQVTRRAVANVLGCASAIALGSAYIISYIPKGGGPPLPKSPPAESRRIYHPRGFSIIAPPGWFRSIDSESISLSAKWSRYSDYIRVFAPGSDYIDVIEANANLLALRRSETNFTFKNHPAVRKIGKTIDRRGYPSLFQTITFEANGRVFIIVYERWADPPPDDVPSDILPYLESFREDRPASGEEERP